MGDSLRNELREAKHAKVLYISFGVFQDAALFDTKEVGIMNLGEYYFANLRLAICRFPIHHAVIFAKDTKTRGS